MINAIAPGWPPRPAATASIVIPAHNEAALITGCIARLLDDAAPDELDVVVVANGCTDGTADVARLAGVRVLETPIAGKINALEIGDASCSAFPRLYIDADVELDTASVRALVATMAEPGVLGCAPVPTWDLTGTGMFARRVHQVHETLMGPHRALSGVGVYVLGEAAHRRVFPLPDVVADDEWVHRCLHPTERRVVATACSVVRPTRTIRAHLRRRVRCRAGNYQLDLMGWTSWHGRLRLRALRALVTRGAVTRTDAVCYLTVAVLERARTRWRRSRSRAVAWGADRPGDAAGLPA